MCASGLGVSQGSPTAALHRPAEPGGTRRAGPVPETGQPDIPGPVRSTPARATRAPGPARLPRTKKKPRCQAPGLQAVLGRRPTLPPGLPGSTIGAGGLNFSVRNGKRCFPSAIATPMQATIEMRRWYTQVKRLRKTGQASRLISTGRLKSSRTLHLPPIDVVVSNEPSGGIRHGIPILEVCFALRGFQRLSRPNIATRRCPWQNNRYTRGSFTPVLSY